MDYNKPRTKELVQSEQNDRSISNNQGAYYFPHMTHWENLYMHDNFSISNISYEPNTWSPFRSYRSLAEAFVNGFLSVVNLGETFRTSDYLDYYNHVDPTEKDWEMVGLDLKYGIQQYERESQRTASRGEAPRLTPSQ